MNEKTIDKRIFWYKNPYNLFQMLESSKNREVVILHRTDNWKCIRGLRISYINLMKDYLFKIFRVPYNDFNIYMSLAEYKEIPVFTLDLSERSKETSQWFDNRSYKDIINYDLLLDFDFVYDEKEKYFKEVLDFIELLTIEKIKFRILFSGNGYQIVIPSDIWGFKNEQEKLIISAKSIINQLKVRFILKYLDVSGAGVHNKIMKLPYSLVVDKVVLPTKNCYAFEFYDSQNIYNTIETKNRGLMWINEDKTHDNFKYFCYKYYIDLI